MTNRESQVSLAALGPVHISEPTLNRRIRFHQAWYRVAVLGEREYGATRPPGSRPLGSILSAEAASAGRNFVSDEAADLFRVRHRAGWGIDPVRTSGYLTSSQALTINIFGSFAHEYAWLARILQRLLGSAHRAVAVTGFDIEHFSPRPSDGLGDRTTVDVVIHALTADGPLEVGIETKLGDRFNSRHVRFNERYERVAHLWRDPELVSARRQVNQLARCHAVVEDLASGVASRNERPRALLLLLHSASDASARIVGAAYRKVLSDRSTFAQMTLGEFLAAMSVTAVDNANRHLTESLVGRYVDMNPSEFLWQESERIRRARPPVSHTLQP